MIKIICDTEEQMGALQTFMVEAKECPFYSMDIPNECDGDFNCYLCIRDNIEWVVKHEQM